MTADYVWLSTAMSDGRQLRPLTHSFSNTAERLAHARECRRLNDEGASIGADCFPRQIFPSEYAKGEIKQLPHLFFAGSYWVVSEPASKILFRHDMGGGSLFSVQVMQRDRTTRVADHGWFCVNFGNVKQAFLAEHSRNIRPFLRTNWHAMGVFGDLDAAVSMNALSGPEIWIDPLLDRGLFLSSSLGDDLKKAKCSSGWSLKKCRVVGI